MLPEPLKIPHEPDAILFVRVEYRLLNHDT